MIDPTIRLKNERELLDFLIAGLIRMEDARKILSYCELAGCDIRTSIKKLEIPVESLSPQGTTSIPQLHELFQKPNPDHTFENFISCPENEFSLEIARSLIEKREKSLFYNPLYIYGNIGVGKTHLLSAIYNQYQDKSIFITSLELKNIYSAHPAASNFIINYINNFAIICIDDIQLFDSSEQLQLELFQIFNTALAGKKHVIVTSDVPPTRLKGIEERLISRLGGGVIANLGMGDSSFKRRVIEGMDKEGVFPPVVTDFIANHIFDNIRHLKSVIHQLLTLNETMKIPLTVETARSFAPTGHDLNNTPECKNPAPVISDSRRKTRERFRHMVESAETVEEQRLAIEIAMNDRLRELRELGESGEEYEKLKKSIEFIQCGEIGKAMELFQI